MTAMEVHAKEHPEGSKAPQKTIPQNTPKGRTYKACSPYFPNLIPNPCDPTQSSIGSPLTKIRDIYILWPNYKLANQVTRKYRHPDVTDFRWQSGGCPCPWR